MRPSTRAVLVFSAVVAFAQTPRSADTLVAEATAQAAGQRAIFTMFHASWCGWCHKLDSFIESPEIKPIVNKYFVTLHLDVLEVGDKKSLDTPGADEMMKRWGGASAGLPFVVFLDSKGFPGGDQFGTGRQRTHRQQHRPSL